MSITVGELNAQVGLQLSKLDNDMVALKAKLGKANDLIREMSARGRRESVEAAGGMGEEIGDQAAQGLERSLGLHHAVKGLFMGIGIGSVEKAVESIVEPWKEAAKAAEEVEKYTAESYELSIKIRDLYIGAAEKLTLEGQELRRLNKEADEGGKTTLTTWDKIRLIAASILPKGLGGVIGQGLAEDVGGRADADRAEKALAAKREQLEVDRLALEVKKKEQETTDKIRDISEKINDLHRTDAERLELAQAERDYLQTLKFNPATDTEKEQANRIAIADAELKVAELTKKVNEDKYEADKKYLEEYARLTKEQADAEKARAEELKRSLAPYEKAMAESNKTKGDELTKLGGSLGTEGQTNQIQQRQLSAMESIEMLMRQLIASGGTGAAG